MLDSAAYRANETNAKRAVADWRLSNINDPHIFQNQGFPVRADSFLDLAQILDTMQERRFDDYVKELGGFTDEDTSFFVKVCLDYVNFYCSTFQRSRVVIPLSTLIAHFVIYKKLLGYNPKFSRLLEIGPGCGYLSFFLRSHEALVDYTQIESTESFYLLQSHINSHVFGSRFSEHALSKQAPYDHGAYVPKLQLHDNIHYEEQHIINVEMRPTCNHYPWWRIGEVANRRYDLVTSNANLNEFSSEALVQYLSLIRDVLVDDGAIIAQCLGGGAPTYESIFASMKSAGFVPVGLVRWDNVPSQFFTVANAVFVGERHPLFSKYANVEPRFPMLDRDLSFLKKMYFLNEEHSERKRVHTIPDVLHAILLQIDILAQRSDIASRQRRLDARTTEQNAEAIVSSAPLRDVNRLRKVAQIEAYRTDDAEAPEQSSIRPKIGRSNSYRTEAERIHLAAEIKALRHTVDALRSSTSWKVTAPLRAVGQLVRRLRA